MIHESLFTVSTSMPNLLYRDHVRLTNKRKILVEILEIIRTLLLLFSFRPVTVSLVVNYDIVVNEVVLLASRIS